MLWCLNVVFQFCRVYFGGYNGKKKLFFDDDSRYLMNYALMKFRYHNLQFINDDDDDDVSVVIFKWAIRSNK